MIQTASPETATEDTSPGSGTMLALVAPLERRARRPRFRCRCATPTCARSSPATSSAVDVTQQFENPYDEKIEAVYLFPLPEKAAVNEFVMTIGERKIRGILREKEEARQIYEDARAQGYRASLLVQHRPNIFEQKVANIEPGKRIDVNIRYFHTLAYEDGWYSFVFPTVVGPRYNPHGLARSRRRRAPRELSRRRPPARPSAICGRASARRTISRSASTSMPASPSRSSRPAHAVATRRDGETLAHVELAGGSTIPNRDFVLKFRVAGEQIKSNLLTYTDAQTKQGYFTLLVYPPAAPADVAPAARRDGVRRRYVGVDVGSTARAGARRYQCGARAPRAQRHVPDHEFLVERAAVRELSQSPPPTTTSSGRANTCAGSARRAARRC